LGRMQLPHDEHVSASGHGSQIMCIVQNECLLNIHGDAFFVEIA
jgi:hypothetical protein